jgi:Mn2+/Fe2+ NRAMP family transporter
MEAIGMACVALFLPFLLIAAITALVGGGIGSFTTRKNKDARKVFIVILVTGLCLAIYVSLAFIPEDFWDNLHPSYKLGDKKLQPYEVFFEHQSVALAS